MRKEMQLFLQGVTVVLENMSSVGNIVGERCLPAAFQPFGKVFMDHIIYKSLPFRFQVVALGTSDISLTGWKTNPG